MWGYGAHGEMGHSSEIIEFQTTPCNKSLLQSYPNPILKHGPAARGEDRDEKSIDPNGICVI